MADNTTDLLMFFEDEKGLPIPAECLLEIDQTDTIMMEGFEQGKYFEVEDFETSVEVRDEDSSKQAGPNDDPRKTSGKSRGVGEFLRWRSATDDELKQLMQSGSNAGYKSEVDTVSFSRQIDKASTVLFEACCYSKGFTRAVLVKRRSTGRKLYQAILRLEFAKVLVTGQEWDDGDVLKEKCTFVCRQMTVLYRQQNFDGSLKSPQMTRWTQPDET